MKTKNFMKVAATAVLVLVSTTLFAQNGRVSIGAEVGLPTGDFGTNIGIGFGGTVGYEHPIGDAMGLGLRAGYITFAGKDLADGISFNMIPIQAFFKYYFQGEAQQGIYGMANVGVHMSSTSVEGSESSTDLSYAPEIGYHLDNIDIGVRYQMISGKDALDETVTNSYIGIRLAYVFGEK